MKTVFHLLLLTLHVVYIEKIICKISVSNLWLIVLTCRTENFVFNNSGLFIVLSQVKVFYFVIWIGG